jgi:LacI family transcriptional regulator
MSQRPRRVTLRDIAEQTGLSAAAVSYALRGMQVPEETQQRVQEVADRLGYQADPIARALASGRTDQVGVLAGSLTDIWQQGIGADLGRGLLRVDRHALIVDASNDPQLEASLAQQLVDKRVDALIVLPVDPRAEHWAQIAEQTVLVSVGDGLPGVSTAAEVVFDNEAGVSDALRTLARVGHRRIAVLTPGRVTTPDRPAELIVQQMADELNLDARLYTSPNDLTGACAVALEVLHDPDPPTAFFCLADSMAYGVYAAARELDLCVPAQLSVLGYDDNAVSRLLDPPLSSYRWPTDVLVSSVVERTMRAIEGRKHTRRKVLTPTAQPRGSLAAPYPPPTG